MTDDDAMQRELEERFTACAEKIRKDAQKALGDIEVMFLPHLLYDFNRNVAIDARNEVKEFMAGRGRYKTFLEEAGCSAVALRQRFYQDHKDEVIAALGKDFEAMIEALKKEVATAWGKSHDV